MFLCTCMQRQPEIHLFAARLKEQRDDVPGARAAYQLVHTEISPGLLEAIIDHANMERRLVKIFQIVSADTWNHVFFD